MWVAVLLGGWLATSLLVGPLVGRIVSTHIKVREETAAKTLTEPPAAVTKPIRMIRRA